MPLDCLPLSQLTSASEVCKVKVRIVRIWGFPKKDRAKELSGIDLLLLDEKGDRIQASVKGNLLSKFEKQLQEDECCVIMNFELANNIGSFRCSSHPYKINFNFYTCVKPCDQIPNLSKRFNFCPFPNIIDRTNDDNIFVDILGEVIGMYDMREVKTSEGPTKVLNLQIKDLGLSIIDVALWGKLAEDVHSELQTNTDGPIVLVGSLMKTRLYNGKGTVQSSKFASKVFINSTMPEITQFKEALLEGEERSSYAIVPIASSNSIQISKHTFSLSERKTIDQITELNAGQSYDILAKIASTRSEKPWFFISCTVCYTKVVPYFNPDTEEIEANKFSCVKCKKQITATQMRYNLYIQAIDHTSTASFLLFDDVVIPLINKSAYELREQQVQFNSSDQFPEELLALEGREYVFKILIPDTTAQNSSYRVVSLTEDPNIIKEFTYTHSNLIAPEGEIIAISGISDGTTNQTHNVSSEAENLDFSNSGNVSTSTKTPKRSLPATEDVGVQHSSTKQKLLSKNQIKKEKK